VISIGSDDIEARSYSPSDKKNLEANSSWTETLNEELLMTQLTSD